MKCFPGQTRDVGVPGWMGSPARPIDPRNRRAETHAGGTWDFFAECGASVGRSVGEGPRKLFSFSLFFFRVAFIVGGERGQEHNPSSAQLEGTYAVGTEVLFDV
jgi:hypothetical protein